ncbi:MAG: DegT/DnrJ/EryC1/StrS family aminotransferase [Polyangiales bacterium]
MALNDQPRQSDDILSSLGEARAHDVPWRTGHALGYVFETGAEAQSLGKRAYADFLTENGLDPTAFPSYRRLENEVIGWVLDQTRAPDGAVGIFTSGGTESILLAVKAARERAAEQRPSVTRFEIILPVTAHAAFHKAAHYFGLDVVLTEVDPVTYTAKPEAIAAAITDRTAMVVASAPPSRTAWSTRCAPSRGCARARRPPTPTAALGVAVAVLPASSAPRCPDYDFAVEGVLFDERRPAQVRVLREGRERVLP